MLHMEAVNTYEEAHDIHATTDYPGAYDSRVIMAMLTRGANQNGMRLAGFPASFIAKPDLVAVSADAYP